MKKILIVFTLITVMFMLSACRNTEPNEDLNDDGDSAELIEFTLSELAQYDGLEGRKAYIAVDGYVYDVTDSALWSDGLHQGRVQAGQDLTEALDTESPHGREMLNRVPKIGILVDSTDNGDDSADNGDDSADNGDDSADNGDDSADNGDDSADNGDDIADNGDDSTDNGDDSTDNGDDSTDNGDDIADNGDDSTDNGDDSTDDGDEDTLRVFTLDELAEYDGLNGNDAYIAVDGFVYDVSNSTRWTDGIHQGQFQAGQDLTDEIDSISPHGRSVLNNIPIIGTLE